MFCHSRVGFALIVGVAVVMSRGASAQEFPALDIVESNDHSIGFDLELPPGAAETLGSPTDAGFQYMLAGEAFRTTEAATAAKFSLAPFFFQFDPSLRFTTNAFSSPDDEESDIFLSTNLQLGLASALANHPDITIKASAYLEGTRYYDSSSLDSNTAGGAFTLTWTKPLETPTHPGQRVLTFKLTPGYAPSVVYDRNFDNRIVTAHPISLTAQCFVPIGGDDSGWGFTIAMRGAHVFNDPSEFDYSEGQATAALGWTSADKKLSLQGGLKGRYRAYDDYFEDTFGESREDFTFNPAVGVEWRVHDNIALSAGLDFIDNMSALDAKDYDALVGQTGLSIRF